MLAKDIKIAKLKQQREFIMENLVKEKNSPRNKALGYGYVGYIFPEVTAYLNEEGFTVKEIHSDEWLAKSMGLPLHLIVPSDEIQLTPEEIMAAEEVVTTQNDESETILASSEALNNLFDMLSSMGGGE